MLVHSTNPANSKLLEISADLRHATASDNVILTPSAFASDGLMGRSVGDSPLAEYRNHLIE
jgi:hypothetical protein